MPDFALELSFDEVSDAAITAQWHALREAGLPSQADHKGMTNAPHVTVVAAPQLDPALGADAATRITLPTALIVRGLVLFGEGKRVTVAHLVEPDAELASWAAHLRGQVPDLRHPVWTPHVTLARRVPRSKVADVLAVLDEHPPPTTLTATRLRWWDPETGTIDEVAGPPPE